MDLLLGISILFCFLLLSESYEKRKGIVRDVFEKKKFSCTSEGKKAFTVESGMQCVSKCLKERSCQLINFVRKAENEMLKNNCEVFTAAASNANCQLISTKQHWLAMRVQQETKFDGNKKEGDKKKENEYNSCKEIYSNRGNNSVNDGIYNLQSGRHYCAMSSLGECGGGGWTLALSINGSKQTFNSDSPYWTNEALFNVANGLQSPMTEEAKYAAFSRVNFIEICIGLTFGGISKWLLISQSKSSLYDLFKDNSHVATNLGREKWKTFIQGASLQYDCNKEGFNVDEKFGEIIARIGIIGNDKKGRGVGSQCRESNSYIGLGTKQGLNKQCMSGILSGVSCGNLAMCNPDNGERSVAAIGMIYIK